jgi:hypothetical protein
MPAKQTPKAGVVEAAARRLQRFWLSRRHLRVARLAQRFFSVADARRLTFQQLIPFLRDTDRVRDARRFIERVHHLSVYTRAHAGEPTLLPEEKEDKINVRVILAALMIAFFPSNVFERVGTIECRAIDAALPLIAVLERLRVALLTPGLLLPRALLFDLTPLIYAYIRHFNAWKKPDEAKLLQRIRNALWALYEARRVAMEGPNAVGIAADVLGDMDNQIARLRQKMHDIGGDGVLAEFDLLVHGAPPPTEEGGARPVPDAPVPNANNHELAMNNEQLAHELLIDPQFRISMDIEDRSHRGRVHDRLCAYYWKSMADDLATAVFTRFLNALDSFRADLIALNPADARLLQDLLDLPLLRQRLENHALEWAEVLRLFDRLFVVLDRMHVPADPPHPAAVAAFQALTQSLHEEWAPLHDTLVEQGADEVGADDDDDQGEMMVGMSAERAAALVALLRFLQRRINLIRVARANERLEVITPTIRLHGAEYERVKFADRLRAGTVRLDETRTWIARVVRAATPDLQAAVRAREAPALVEMYTDGVLEVAAFATLTLMADSPEVLARDRRRLEQARADFDRLSLLAARTVLTTRRRDLGLLTPEEAAARIQRAEAAAVNDEAEDPDVRAPEFDDVHTLMAARLRELVAGFAHDHPVPADDVRFRVFRPIVHERAQVLGRLVARIARVARDAHGDTLLDDLFVAAAADADDGDVPTTDEERSPLPDE